MHCEPKEYLETWRTCRAATNARLNARFPGMTSVSIGRVNYRMVTPGHWQSMRRVRNPAWLITTEYIVFTAGEGKYARFVYFSHSRRIQAWKTKILPGMKRALKGLGLEVDNLPGGAFGVFQRTTRGVWESTQHPRFIWTGRRFEWHPNTGR